MNKKPLAIKIIVLLLCLYGIINLISNYVYSFYISYSGGLFDISFPVVTFALISVPMIPLFVAAILIWRGGRIGQWTSIILLALSFLTAIGGGAYLAANLPKLFTEDLLYLTKNPPTSMNWTLDTTVDHYAFTNSLTVYRVLIVKSLLKSVIEVISCGYLAFIVMRYSPPSNQKNKSIVDRNSIIVEVDND